jgi:hypothetical protein
MRFSAKIGHNYADEPIKTEKTGLPQSGGSPVFLKYQY